MDKPLAVLFTIWSLALVVFLVKKSWRKGLLGVASERPSRLFVLAGFFTSINYILAACGDGIGIYQVIACVYFFVPALLALVCRPNLFVDLLLICWLWIPNDFSLRLMFKSWGGGMFGYALTAFIGMAYVLILFTGWRKVDFNLDWSFTKKDWAWIFGAYLVLAAVIIPVAIPADFIHAGLIKNPLKALLALVIWFAPALCEELIFRGVIQRVMIGWLRPFWGIAIASVIFGFAHIDNKAGAHSYPNWWYVVFASAAGVAYGIVAHKRNLQSSATLHFLVDFTWVIFFRSGK